MFMIIHSISCIMYHQQTTSATSPSVTSPSTTSPPHHHIGIHIWALIVRSTDVNVLSWQHVPSTNHLRRVIIRHVTIRHVTASPPYLGISIFGHSYRDLHKWPFLQKDYVNVLSWQHGHDWIITYCTSLYIDMTSTLIESP